MLKILFKTTVFVVLFFIPQVVFGNVVINEVLYDAGTNDTGNEYVILYNNDELAADLTNYELNTVSGDYYVFPSFSLGAKSFVAIHWRTEGINSQTDLYTGISGYNANMGDTSGWTALFEGHPTTGTAKDLIIDYLEYGTGAKTWEGAASDAGIWTAGNFIPDISAGKSIKLKIDGQDNNSPNDWAESNPTITIEEPASTSEQTTTQQESSTSTTNNPPLPDAGNDIIAFVGQEIDFDGTQSTDPEGDELHYEWNMGDGKLIEKPNFTYKYLYPGTYLVALMVYDGRYYVTDTITVKIQSAQITINEFMPNPSGKDEEAEWVEIYNDSEGIADISGWQLDDGEKGSSSFIFPQNTLIAPKSYLVFSRQITGIALNNDKDTIRLLLPENVIFQEVNYEKPPQGKSSARTNEGFVWSMPTPGTINLSIVTTAESKKVVYQGIIKKETTKEPSQDIAINYTAPLQKIEGGYAEITAAEANTESKNQLASAKESVSKHISDNLVYVFVIIVLAGLIIGLLLAKFRRRKNEFPQI
jgi:hypothetical protein